jgi:hypothetical protein
MADRERHIELAREGLEAYNRGDQDVVLDGYAEGIGGWNDAWDEHRFEITGIEVVDDSHIVVAVHQTGIGRESRVPVEMDAVLLVQVVDERARRFHVHPDRESALAAIP